MTLGELFHNPAAGPISNRHLAEFLLHLERSIMTTIDEATASTAAKVAALATEVANANAKTDAALATLAASVASGQSATQAQIDAITAIGAVADSSVSQLQGEEANVDAALTPPAPSPAPAPAEGSSSAT